ncbi:MAG: P1 family peptidase [Caldilineaceae bacterium]|nr:P1 family peptidase [Caldilineaceae bacterium]
MKTGHNSLTDIPGLRVGHWTHTEAATGCTVILCPEGAVAGVDVRGGAPGTREIALLDPVCTVERVNAVLLTGGSAFGLAAADGVVRWLEEHGYGFDVGVAKVPIVPAAVLFDLATGNPNVRPDASAGYAACQAASAGTVAEGNVGAGTGATVGKMLGLDRASKGGLGTASRQIGQELVVAALVAVNAIGSIIDPATQQIIAGARLDDGSFANPRQMTENHLRNANLTPGANTTIAVVATNAALTKTEATKVAQMAHDGLARVINPIHTASDGDTVFALSLGKQAAPASLIGAVAAEVLSEAVLRAVGE